MGRWFDYPPFRTTLHLPPPMKRVTIGPASLKDKSSPASYEQASKRGQFHFLPPHNASFPALCLVEL